MKIKVHCPADSGISASEFTRLLQDLLGRQLQPLLQKRGADETIVHATLTYLTHANRSVSVKLHVHLPGKKIVAATGQADGVRAAAEKAAAHLLREVRRHFDLLHDQHRFKRKARGERLNALKAQIEALPAATVQAAQSGIDPLLPKLESVARRELAYLRAVGDLPVDYPSVADVVDEALATTKAAWQPGRAAEKVLPELLKHLFKAIDREVEASRIGSESISLDAPVPEDASDQAEAMVEEEFYEYYQPDDTVSVADVLPVQADAQSDAPAEPEQPEAAQGTDTAAISAMVVDILKDLPLLWRRALLLVEFDALPVSLTADVLQADEPTTTSWVTQARAFVQARLGDKRLVQQGATLSEWRFTVRTG